ncbi:MAG: DUF896 domain-containing protein [Oscillospiraceae bacterium]|nr:DUF896 domain-containing protein [Oscillospiraceae bacterium]MBR0063954.1 DUF896 domain-containing protein [Oscillospiraceae bacterium]
MEQKRIDRISELTRISRERVLTDEELAERAELRREYIEAVKASLAGQLENTYVVDEKGNKRPLGKK